MRCVDTPVSGGVGALLQGNHTSWDAQMHAGALDKQGCGVAAAGAITGSMGHESPMGLLCSLDRSLTHVHTHTLTHQPNPTLHLLVLRKLDSPGDEKRRQCRKEEGRNVVPINCLRVLPHGSARRLGLGRLIVLQSQPSHAARLATCWRGALPPTHKRFNTCATPSTTVIGIAFWASVRLWLARGSLCHWPLNCLTRSV